MRYISIVTSSEMHIYEIHFRRKLRMQLLRFEEAVTIKFHRTAASSWLFYIVHIPFHHRALVSVSRKCQLHNFATPVQRDRHIRADRCPISCSVTSSGCHSFAKWGSLFSCSVPSTFLNSDIKASYVPSNYTFSYTVLLTIAQYVVSTYLTIIDLFLENNSWNWKHLRFTHLDIFVFFIIYKIITLYIFFYITKHTLLYQFVQIIMNYCL